MFTTGQWIFAGIFVVVFAFFITRAYRRDTGLHKRNYSGVQWVALVFALFVILLFVIKYLLRN